MPRYGQVNLDTDVTETRHRIRIWSIITQFMTVFFYFHYEVRYMMTDLQLTLSCAAFSPTLTTARSSTVPSGLLWSTFSMPDTKKCLTPVSSLHMSKTILISCSFVHNSVPWFHIFLTLLHYSCHPFLSYQLCTSISLYHISIHLPASSSSNTSIIHLSCPHVQIWDTGTQEGLLYSYSHTSLVFGKSFCIHWDFCTWLLYMLQIL